MKLPGTNCQRSRLLAVIAVVLSTQITVTRAEEVPAVGVRPPFWAEKGALVYRVSTPDQPDVLPQIEAGTGMVSHLTDGSVKQILILNGIIGHDHPGPWNWDGLWPYWNHVTFRGGGNFKALSDFMVRAHDKNNAFMSFHLNLTDVNIGLRDYPETRDFFKKLVAARAIYRRDWNPQTQKRDVDPPYVPQALDPYITEKDANNNPNPVPIFALVDYKKFWESGIGKGMIDEFYGHLPYAPPLLYLDVLNLSGGNFETGFPDGPLGGSEKTQLEGAISLIDYLRSKGTDLATEGPRPIFGKRAGYVWLHGPGLSEDDYSTIGGATGFLVRHHVHGNSGAFNLSPIASTAPGVKNVKDHYAALLAGKPGPKKVAGLDTWHIAYRAGVKDEFDIPGTGDPFRGDWADLVNNFYLTMIQELYHIGKRSIRTRFDGTGTVHLGKYTLSAAGVDDIGISVPEFVPSLKGKGLTFVMLEDPIVTQVTVPRAGRYSMSLSFQNANAQSRLNVYVNRILQRTVQPKDFDKSPLMVGQLELKAGENEIAFDVGPIRATWTDGTVAEWTTPYLRTGFKAFNGDVVFADDYDRMWPDSWSGKQKIHFFSWDGTNRTWKLPVEWASKKTVALYPLTPTGRGKRIMLFVKDRSVSPILLPQVPYIVE